VNTAIFALCNATISKTVDNTTKTTIILYCFCFLHDAECYELAIAKFLSMLTKGNDWCLKVTSPLTNASLSFFQKLDTFTTST